MVAVMSSIHPFLLFLLVFAVGILSAETGAWLIRRREKKVPREKDGQVGSMVGALLGLLAFMLGFTFSITASRFSERKHLVVDQARAIATCYLRTSLIPEKQKQETRKLLSRYTDLLVAAPNSSMADLSELEAIQTQIWRQTASLRDENMDSPLRSLYISSVNEVLDIFGERKTVVLVFRIPGAIWAALILLYVLGMFIVGTEIGSFKLRRSLNVPIMTAAFATIVTLIAAMDASSRRGHFTVSQQALIDVQKMIREDLAHPVQ